MVQHMARGLETLVTAECGYMFMLYFTASPSEGAQGGAEGQMDCVLMTGEILC